MVGEMFVNHITWLEKCTPSLYSCLWIQLYLALPQDSSPLQDEIVGLWDEVAKKLLGLFSTLQPPSPP